MAVALPTPGSLISEPIEPDRTSFEAAAAARGEPGLPWRFGWRGHTWQVQAVERRWRTTGPDRGGSRERYARRHWAVVRTVEGVRLRIYGDRGAVRSRWWLHSVEPPLSAP